jgi:UDP-glucose 4-epimerase
VTSSSRQSPSVGLRDSRVLITGGAGTVGSTLADHLVSLEPAEIVILDNFTRGRKENLAWCRDHAPVTIVDGDIRDARLVEEITDGIDVVFHEAAIRLPQCTREPRLALEVMVDGTFNVVEAAERAGVRKVVAASSASVYGMAERFPTTEDHHPYGNRTLYGAAKVFGENLLRCFYEQHGLDYVVLRYFNVYGPRMDMHSAHAEVLVHWLQCIASEEPPLIHGDGRQTTDFVFVDDVVRANVLAAMSEVTDVVCNVASGVETSLGELARELIAVMGADLTPSHEVAGPLNSVARRLGDTSTAERLLGWRPEVDLRTGLERLVAWWREATSVKHGSLT